MLKKRFYGQSHQLSTVKLGETMSKPAQTSETETSNALVAKTGKLARHLSYAEQVVFIKNAAANCGFNETATQRLIEQINPEPKHATSFNQKVAALANPTATAGKTQGGMFHQRSSAPDVKTPPATPESESGFKPQ